MAPHTGHELLTGVERYKSDTVCIELGCGNNKSQGDIVMGDNEQLKREFTDDEHRRLVDYFSLLIEIDQQEKERYAKLNLTLAYTSRA